MQINFFNRYQNRMEIEKVYGGGAVQWLYRSYLGKLLNRIITSRWISQLYGLLQDLPFSKFKVETFAQDYGVDLDDFIPEQGRSAYHPYSTFNAFFIRRWKEGRRPFIGDPKIFPAFVEGRYLGFNKMEGEKIPVKGVYVDPLALVANSKWNHLFQQGPVVIGRLCPVDYHRFHFPLEGKILDHWTIHGKYHSVNPVALEAYPEIFLQNERQVTIIECEQYGHLAYIEVGATCVGKIVQTYQGDKCVRGQEKGYFLFGGSTVIVLGEAGRWELSEDICQNSLQGIETYVHLGDQMGHLKV